VTSTLCPGTCNSKYRRARAVYEAEVAQHALTVERLTDAGLADKIPVPPTPPAVDPVYGDPVWCSRCAAIIRRELAELDELASSLANLPPGIRPASDGTRERVKVTGSVAVASPSPTGDDLDDLYRWLAEWETWYRKLRSWDSPPPRGYLNDRITASVNWLSGRLDGLLVTGEAEPFGIEVRGWHRELVAKTHSARAAKHVKKPCPRCGKFQMWEEIGKDYVRCHNEDCNRMMTREELNQAVTA
jgi:hypothetical protein